MGIDEPIEKLIHRVTDLERGDCIALLRDFHNPGLDFTDDFLNAQSLDSLRHLLLAACLQVRKRRQSVNG